jgi:hypothetical protein
MDKARKKWAKYCNDVVLTERLTCTYELYDIGTRENEQYSNVAQGWALKTSKTRQRFSDNVKNYLSAKFQHGEASGNKSTPKPKEVEKEMKTLKNDNGQKVFRQCEHLTASQIASYFLRLANKAQAENKDVSDEHLMAALAEIEERELLDSLANSDHSQF